MLGIIIIMIFFYSIFYLAVLWEFAVKTGRPGWSLYIPIYSNYVFFDIAGMNPIWFILNFVPSIAIIVFPSNIIIFIISFIFTLIISVYFCYSLSKSFNKGIGYAIGLFLLNPVFVPILALNKNCIYNEDN